MITAYKTVNDELTSTSELGEKGSWVDLVNPSETEIQEVASKTGILPDFLRAALDEEERPRIESENSQLLVLIDIPVARQNGPTSSYDTIPLGIMVTETHFATVCLQRNPVIDEFTANRTKSFYTHKKTRFVLQILFKTAQLYLRYLKQIDTRTTEIERRLQQSMKNENLFILMGLEKALVYFTTSLKSNQFVMEKLLRSQIIKVDPEAQVTSQLLKMYPEDQDLMEDVITENKQAIEMSEIYSIILSGMMDAFASVISNNVNIVMKFLTSVTIIMAVPTIVASFYGMNVTLPLQKSPYAFPVTILISLVLSTVGVIILSRKRMF